MHPTDYYRLPWTLNDNVLSWLEPTKKCNIYCDGCYSTNEHDSHKTLEQVRSDLTVFTRERKMDSVSIAGGDPLTHPEIVEIVRMTWRDFGLKPVLNTNGHAMTPEMLHALKEAGLHGVTFHIDSSQSRPGWKKQTNLELNALRLHFAEMVAKEGGLTCAFNSTVFWDTLGEVPALIRWAREHIDIVHSMVFILFRTARSAEFRYLAHDREVSTEDLVYYDQGKGPAPLTTPEVFAVIRADDPDFQAAAYLGGTRDPSSFKWTLVSRIGTPGASGRVYGYVGPRFMEVVQQGHHALRGTYLAYSAPWVLRKGRSTLAMFAPIDKGVRRAAGRWARHMALSPSRIKERLYIQSFAFIQPIDMMPDGEANMCDGCPDMTVHEGKLVWSCRLDELKRHGTFLSCVPRG